MRPKLIEQRNIGLRVGEIEKMDLRLADDNNYVMHAMKGGKIAAISRGVSSYYRFMFNSDLKLKNDDIVLDIGAHIGLFALPVSKICRTIAIEPGPANFELLKRNCVSADVRWGAVTCGDAETVKLYVSIYGTTGHSTEKRKRGGIAIDVPNYNFGELLKSAGVSVVKIDAEGIERKILLEEEWGNIRLLCCEYHFTKDKSNYGLCIESLKRCGFAVQAKTLQQLPDKPWFTKIVGIRGGDSGKSQRHSS